MNATMTETCLDFGCLFVELDEITQMLAVAARKDAKWKQELGASGSMRARLKWHESTVYSLPFPWSHTSYGYGILVFPLRKDVAWLWAANWHYLSRSRIYGNQIHGTHMLPKITQNRKFPVCFFSQRDRLVFLSTPSLQCRGYLAVCSPSGAQVKISQSFATKGF